MPEGRAQAIESAASWGSLNGGLIAALADADGRGVVGATLGTGLAALGTAVLLTRERSPVVRATWRSRTAAASGGS